MPHPKLHLWCLKLGFTNAHDVTLTGLTPGTMYSMRVQVMGSGNQVTEWSNTVQQMAT
jgi:hypothetical protein